ncbi:MAG: SDR family NAD(P)-dependent oxidoreductase [Pseudomonadota bacterium]
MRSFLGKRYWLIGASEGIGRAIALSLSKEGAEVIVSARNAERLAEVVAEVPGKASAQVIDVGDRASVEAAADAVGDVDGIVFLAGLYWPMKPDEWQAADAETMADVNYVGAVRVVGAVLPKLLARGEGHLVLTGSLSGFRGLPGAAVYGSSKAGVMQLAESLYADLRRTKIDIQLSNPGFVRTRLTEKNDFHMPFIMDPDEAARHILDHMRSDRFKQSFPSLFASFFRISQLMPDWLYYAIMRPSR